MASKARDMDNAAPLSGRRLALGAGMMGAGSVLKVALQFVMLPVMARLLGPSEFGLYALAMPTVTFLQVLADGGFGNSLAREPESSTATWSTAFWVLHGFCALLAIVVIGWSFLLAGWTHQPRLPPLMAVLSLSLLLLAASILPGARLTRRGQLGTGAIADLLANCVGAAAGVALALHKAGAWSLVAQYLVTYATRTVLLNVAAFEMPTFQFNLRSLTGHFAVGGALVGGKLADFVGRMIENSVLSRGLGASALGAYSFGNQVPRFVCESVSNPVWATLYVQALRNEREVTLRSYYQLTRLLGLVVLPMAALSAAAAPFVIPFVLGPSWVRAIPVISTILPGYALSVVGGQSGALLYACGRSDISFGIASATAVARVVVVALSPFVGLSGVGLLIGLVCFLQFIVSIFVPAKAIGANPWRVIRSLTSAVVAAAGTGCACIFMLNCHPFSIVWLLYTLIASLIIGAILLIIIERSKLSDDFTSLRKLLFPYK
jgi:PST family polysaccharide transporter